MRRWSGYLADWQESRLSQIWFLWHSPLMQRLWFTVDKVIHHDDVMFPTIIRPRGDIAARDPHPGDEGFAKHNAKEGKAPVAWRCRDEAAEQQFVVGVKVLDQRAGLTVSVLLARSAPIRQVNICEDSAKTSDRRSCGAVARYGEGHVGDIAP